MKTIRLLQTNGVKTPPLVIKEVVPGPRDILSNGTSLEIEVTDAFLTQVSTKHTLVVSVLGDYLSEWWAKNKHKYKIAVHPDDLIGPQGFKFPGGGLDLPSELVSQWRNDFAGQPQGVGPIGIDNALLALNIEGVVVIEEGGIF